MSRSPRLTISIVTLNRRDILEKCLWYLWETTNESERDIWIWDNGSVDDTTDFLGTLVEWPGIRVFRSPTNVGGIPLRRRMLPHVETPFFFTLDDDMWTVTKGWDKAICDVMVGDPTLCQVMIPQGYVHGTSNYGITHTTLDRPFFRVPHILPEPKLTEEEAARRKERFEREPNRSGDGTTAHFAGAKTEEDFAIEVVNGERVGVPQTGTKLPFACPGGCSAWRTADLVSLLSGERERHHTADLREAWSFPLQARGGREAFLADYGLWHPSPGPLWYVGRGERYWEDRCRIAEAVYGRSAETQRAWLDTTREAIGWGRPLEDPDVAFGVLS